MNYVLTDEDVTSAILFALGFKHVSGNQGLELWNRFKSDPGWQADARNIAEQFGDMVEREMLHRFGFPIVARPEYEKQIVAIFFAPPKDRYHKLFNLIRLKIQNCLAAVSHQAAIQYAAVAPNPRQGPLSNPVKAGRQAAASGMHPGAARPAPTPQGGATFISAAKPAPQGGATFMNQPPATPTRAENPPMTQPPESRMTAANPATPPATEVPADAVEPLSPEVSVLGAPVDTTQQETAPPPDPAPGATLWKYIAVADPLEFHDDSDKRLFDASPGFSLIGARVRGRKHKHDGSNCDDWFEVKRAGDWEIIAVSDGAGSCRLSRIGARVCTQAATDFLVSELAEVSLDITSQDDLQTDPASSEFTHRTVNSLRQLLHGAVDAAVKAVQAEATRLYQENFLPTEDAKPLSSTLRLAIHRLLPGAPENSFLMACSVGDGMTAAIDQTGSLQLLGLEESGGKYSGETEFITDPRSVTAARLTAQTFARVLPMRSVMVMTDGVADPYFPNHTEIYRLYADLILNGILEITDDELDAKLAELQSQGITLPDLNKYSYLIDTPTGSEERMPARIRQSDRFAAEMNLTLKELLEWPPALLIAGAAGDPMNDAAKGAPPEERLRIWLDSFYVRGEFDDRTLVILQREAKA
jgi:hypothetical protein